MAVPKLRFRAEDGSEFPEWENERFGNFFMEENNVTAEINKYPLYSLTIESGVIPKTERYERRYLVKKDEAYKIVPPKAFVYNPMNLRFGALAYNKESFAVAVSGYYNVFRLNNESTLDFWANYLITKQMLNYYNSIATGSLVEKLRVHFSRFKKIEKQLPTIKEQQKIADFLSTIDAIISSQKEELAAWEQRKKGVVQKLFSQEVRFKADDGSEFPEWQEKKIKDCCEYATNRNKGYIFVGTENMKKDFNGIKLSENNRLIEGIEFKIGDILMSNIRPYLKKVWLADKCGVCSSDVLVFRSQRVVSAFLYYVIASDRFIEYVMSAAKGSKMPRGDKKHIMEMQLLIPSLPEQQKIAECLSSIEEVIKKEKEELEKWQELKKGLLQQMFV